MDVVRGGAILLVLGYHSSAILGLYGFDPPASIERVNDVLAPLRMPTLVFLSGLLLPRSLAKPRRVYLAGKMRKLFYPCLLWTVIYAIVVGIDARWYQPTFWLASSYLWFLQFVLAYYLIALAARPALRRRSGYHLVLVTLAFLVSLPLESGSVAQRFTFLAGFFFLGAWIATSRVRLRRQLAPSWSYLALVVAVTSSVVAVSRGTGPYESELVIGTLAAVLLFTRFAPEGPENWASRGLASIGRDSMVYYLSHFPVTALAAQLVFQPAGVPVHWSILLALVLSLGCGFLLSRAQASAAVRLLLQAPTRRRACVRAPRAPCRESGRQR